MEVGAVKQAYNNEVILLKKSLNQARIQTIHKLTRKAKTFTEKKAPGKLNEKFKRKAESAVKEVLLMKKIKPKEIAKFIVTHKGILQDYLNKPKVDKEKVCARLLLHKSMQGKYKLIRDRFSNVRIEDLLMSRQERLKLKKEAKEQQKQKKMKKNKKVVNSEGEWNVENIEEGDNSKQCKQDLSSDAESLEDHQEFLSNDNISDDSTDKSDIADDKESENELESDEDTDIDNKIAENDKGSSEESGEDKEESNFGTFVKITPSKANIKSSVDMHNEVIAKTSNAIEKHTKISPSKVNIKSLVGMHKEIIVKTNNEIEKQTNVKKKVEKKSKDMKKNKNFNEKILLRKFKKGNDDNIATEAKVVDPFFITATGENYMSVAEPRQPDEVKEIHKQGNRKLRRAAMFGHVPKIKPKQDNFRPQNNSDRHNGYDTFDKSSFNNKWSKDSNDKTSKFNEHRNNVEDKKTNFNNRKCKFNRNEDEKSEKLHPSWEAKKKQSGILPFQGKKIVFDDR